MLVEALFYVLTLVMAAFFNGGGVCYDIPRGGGKHIPNVPPIHHEIDQQQQKGGRKEKHSKPDWFQLI